MKIKSIRSLKIYIKFYQGVQSVFNKQTYISKSNPTACQLLKNSEEDLI